MDMNLVLQGKDSNLYLPEPARIKRIEQFTEKEKFFEMELERGCSLGHDAGQFVQVSILGIGEAPISVSSPPASHNRFDLCVRAVGDVTNKMHTLNEGDIIHVRGPFGHGFDKTILKAMQGKHLLFIAGGIGYVPLRSLINAVIPDRNEYQKISILYGCRTSSERVYSKELSEINQIGENVELLETVDKGDKNWQGNVGVITTLIPKIFLDPKTTMAVIVGPPIMYKFVLIELMKAKLPKENIYMSLERRMKCGVGKCGIVKWRIFMFVKKGQCFVMRMLKIMRRCFNA